MFKKLFRKMKKWYNNNKGWLFGKAKDYAEKHK